jgi:CHAT domain-containing protein
MATSKVQALPITFAVPGQRGEPAATRGRSAGAAGATGEIAATALPGRIKASVLVGTQRDASAPLRLEAVPGEDIVALHIESGPVLLLHPETARTLLQGPLKSQRGGAGGATDDVLVNAELHWPGVNPAALGDMGGGAASRGLADIGRVIISAFQVLTGLAKEPLVDFAASQIVQRVDGQVNAGVYALQAGELKNLKEHGQKLKVLPSTAGPILVLIHGTFVETTSTFGKLWSQHPTAVQTLFQHYAGAVYALDHPTMGASPIANARTLVDALPNGARLHLLTHSRGGLVAEVLARLAGAAAASVAAGAPRTGIVTAADLAFFAAEGYADQQRELQALGDLIQAKGVQVERVVRVACPARGTLLASGRLDAYVSVLKWTLELAGLVVVPVFVDFIGEVARRRADPAEIPGLAAMMPDTPLVNWLNAAKGPLPGDLRVVSGDLEAGNTVGSWLKSLLADAYYWTDNDIVVHTRSMYGGAARAGGASFLLDKSAAATHFSYFFNDKTALGVVDALVQKESPPSFKTIGPLSWAGKDASGERGAGSRAGTSTRTRAGAAAQAASQSSADPNKPAVFVLPGILGSNLKQGLGANADRIWLSLNLLGNFSRLEYMPNGADQVQEDGPIGLIYNDLIAFLGATHEVIAFGYDWRCPLEEAAKRLAAKINKAMDARTKTGQAVRILAHSMGGLVARTVQIVEPKTWQRLMAHADARLVTLGTPHGGSWAPMQVLSGDDGFGNTLAALGSPFANRKARNLMAAMPGFLQLQAGLLDPALGLDQTAHWEKLANEDFAREQEKNWWRNAAGEMLAAVYRWGVPPQDVLDQAKALRTQLDAQMTGVLRTDAGKFAQVLGHARLTPVGFEVGAEGFVYRNEQDSGDGRVPLSSSRLPGVATWTLDCVHGDLPQAKDAFEAFTDLLMLGTTTRLHALPESRGAANAASVLRSRPSRRASGVTATSTADLQELLSSSTAARDTRQASAAAQAAPVLQVSVVNGNLSFVSQPLLLGHYQSMALTGTEGVVDGHLGGAMWAALQAGLYPDVPGTQHIFFNTRLDAGNPWQLPKPKAAIVVGLGEEGMLTSAQLEATVCQGVKAWAQRAREESAGPLDLKDGIEIAATLVGSGGLGITPGAAARAIARGVWRANQRLAGSGWPLVRKLVLVEWYLDRATDAWRGLQVLAQSQPNAYDMAPTIISGSGPLRRQPETGYRGAAYDLIKASTDADGSISFELDTRRARAEVRAQRTQIKLLKKLVERAATSRSSHPKLGRALFQLLVPLELKPFLSGNERLVMQLDEGTAPIPWELLDTRTEATTLDDKANNLPWSIRTMLLRKLAIKDIPVSARDANADDAVMVIGEPLINDPNNPTKAGEPARPIYPALPGALREAKAVAAAFSGPRGVATGKLVAKMSAPFDDIMLALMSQAYRIVHVAGHGEAITRDTAGNVSEGGVVLSEGVFLGPLEIPRLLAVPELVFVNCCHSAAHDPAQTLTRSRPELVSFAAGVADALIRQGVRCVVAAGWAVDDEPAEAFAVAFYEALLQGQTFAQAVHEARKAAFNKDPRSKTWAAYQCYGDPNWVFRAKTGDAQTVTADAKEEFAGIACAPDLALVLENLGVQASAFSGADDDALHRHRQQATIKLQTLEALFSNTWASVGAVAEAFAVAWSAVGELGPAIHWYEQALQSNDASASIKVQEQLGNLRVRQAWSRAREAKDNKRVIRQSRTEIIAALRLLDALAEMQPTVERLSLSGSARKRLGQLETLAGDPKASNQAFALALAAYTRAESLAIAQDPAKVYYPGMNRMALELVREMTNSSWGGFDGPGGQRVRRSVQAVRAAQPDFFNHAVEIELDFYDAVAARTLAPQVDRLLKAYGDLHSRVATTKEWKSVADQTSFVLNAYVATASVAEKQAAEHLLKRLDDYAGQAA